MRALEPAFSGLLPHPPIVVPEVGGARLDQCRATYEACREFAARLVARKPERCFLISPHSPRRHGAFGVWGGARLAGDFHQFGAPETKVNLPNDRDLATRLEREDAPLWTIPPDDLDHGAAVPLRFLAAAGWDGPTCVVSLPWSASAEELASFGACVARAIDGAGKRAALVASGDMTHRALRGAPAGFHPRAVEFDRTLTELIAHGQLDAIAGIDPELRALAAEDAVESSAVVAAALGFRPRGEEVLSYEHPFGVGYLVAVFHDACGALGALPAVARESIRASLEGRAPAERAKPRGALARRAPVFVTLRAADGSLRGCIGSYRPLTDNLVAETADRARAAAFEDPRFPPVERDELDELAIEVSVLGELEDVDGLDSLDPARYGVLVKGSGGRSGVLLPGIAEVHTAEEQVAIARRKAGIEEGAPVQLVRFPVEKVEEARCRR